MNLHTGAYTSRHSRATTRNVVESTRATVPAVVNGQRDVCCFVHSENAHILYIRTHSQINGLNQVAPQTACNVSSLLSS